MKPIVALCALLLAGSALASPSAAPTNPLVHNKALAAKLVGAYKCVARYGREAGSMDPRVSTPARAKLWRSVDKLATSHVNKESEPVKTSVQALRAFRKDFGEYRATGHEELAQRIMHGHSTTRPGLTTLMQGAFRAAGMGEATIVDTLPH